MKRISILTLIIFLSIGLYACQAGTEETIEEKHPFQVIDDIWTLIFADEFDGETLNDDYWTAANHVRHGSSVVYYSNREENVQLLDGKLVLKALETKQEELYLFEGMPFTSARIESKHKFDFTYGRVIVSAKVAKGAGTWPAIWMLPSDNHYGNWPHSGEIDIMEYYGKRPNIVSAAYHTYKYNHMNTQISTIAKSRNLVDAEERFYTYEIIWTPVSITWYFEGQIVHFYRYNNRLEAHNAHYYEAWPFDQDFHLIMNLGMGDAGGSGAGPIDSEALPTTFEIDYVRVYQIDYETFDQENPSEIEYIELSNINPNYLLWPRAEDDYGVSHYEIALNGNIISTSPVNSYLFEVLFDRAIDIIEVRAVDFTGKTSPWRGLDDATA